MNRVKTVPQQIFIYSLQPLPYGRQYKLPFASNPYRRFLYPPTPRSSIRLFVRMENRACPHCDSHSFVDGKTTVHCGSEFGRVVSIYAPAREVCCRQRRISWFWRDASVLRNDGDNRSIRFQVSASLGVLERKAFDAHPKRDSSRRRWRNERRHPNDLPADKRCRDYISDTFSSSCIAQLHSVACE